MKNKKEDFREHFFAFIQNKGFMWGPFPEIYESLSGFYSYGPLGKLLKNKVENNIRKIFTTNSFWELECPIILPDIVWEASGHLKSFVERVIHCENCKGIFRVDKLVEEYGISGEGFSDQQLLNFIEEKKIKCPSCKGDFRYDIHKHNLMMKTSVAGKDASLRPETATVTYLPFKRYYDFFRKKLPIGVFQIGKAFRNEVSPRQHVIRSREFIQAEAQLFIDPREKNNWEKYEYIKKEKLPLWIYQDQKKNKKHSNISLEEALKNNYLRGKAYVWCLWLAYQQFLNLGIPKERIRMRQHNPDERAFYADDAWDIEIELNSFGFVECCGIHDRTDYDLVQHAKFAKTNLEATREDGSKVVPHVLEIAFGVDRMVFALLDIFYEKKSEEEGKTLFNAPYHLAPVDAAVYPLLKKDNLPEKAIEVKKILENEFIVEYDEAGSIGRRYLRAAESGTPACITIDHQTLEDNTVTLRERNSERQIRVKINDLNNILKKFLNGEALEKLGKIIK